MGKRDLKKMISISNFAIQDFIPILFPFLKQLSALKTQYYSTVLCETGVSKLMLLTLLSHFLLFKKKSFGMFYAESLCPTLNLRTF